MAEQQTINKVNGIDMKSYRVQSMLSGRILNSVNANSV
jgi:hypothetical protein